MVLKVVILRINKSVYLNGTQKAAINKKDKMTTAGSVKQLISVSNRRKSKSGFGKHFISTLEHFANHCIVSTHHACHIF